MFDLKRFGSSREQRLAKTGQGRARLAAEDRGAARAARQAEFATASQRLQQSLSDAGWSDVVVKQVGPSLVASGKDPQGNAHAAHGPDAGAIILALVEAGTGTQRAPEGQTTPAPQPAAFSVTLGDEIYTVTAGDATRLSAGLTLVVMTGVDASISLERGGELVVTTANAVEIARQLVQQGAPS